MLHTLSLSTWGRSNAGKIQPKSFGGFIYRGRAKIFLKTGILRQKQVLISEMLYRNIKVLCIRNFVGYVVNVQYKLITQVKL